MKNQKSRFTNSNSHSNSKSTKPFFSKDGEDSFFSKENFFEQGSFFKPVVQMKRNEDLPEDLQAKMESSFGEDFSDVKFNKDSKAARDLNARAYTQGNNIYFKSGEFNTSSQSGQELIAHELSHVVQQRKGLVRGTHKENGFNVNSEEALERRADAEGKKALNGEKINSRASNSKTQINSLSLQKKSQPIQLWRDVPGQARIESTAPSTRQAWEVFMRAVRQASGQAPEGELRRFYYNSISQRLRGSFQPINIDVHTTDGYNRHWTGTVRFVFGDTETPLSGGGNASTTLSSVSESSQSLGTSSSSTVGSLGGAEVSSSPGSSGGTGGTINAGATGSTTTGVSETQGDTQTAGSTSEVNQRLNRFSSQIGIEVNISVSYDMGSSWTDWVNPFAYASWGGAGIAFALNGDGFATGACGTVVYYKGGGISSSN